MGTLHKKGFHEDRDRFGAVTLSAAKGTSDKLTKLCELARKTKIQTLKRASFGKHSSLALFQESCSLSM